MNDDVIIATQRDTIDELKEQVRQLKFFEHQLDAYNSKDTVGLQNE